jgi:hypothetical protein
MAGRPQSIGGHAIAKLAELGLAEPFARRVDHLGVEEIPAERGVAVRFLAATVVVHVDGRGPVAQGREHVPQGRRVRATGDEASDLAPGLDQPVTTYVRLDAGTERGRPHGPILRPRLARPGTLEVLDPVAGAAVPRRVDRR